VLEVWRDPSSRWRRALASELPEATGFSPEVVREGLARGLADWSGAALHELVEGELDEAARGGLAPSLEGFDLTSLVLAGSIPMPTLLGMLLPLVLRSPVLAKSASRDPVTPRLVRDSIREIDSELGACVEVARFPGENGECLDALLDSPCVVATGSDATVSEIAGRLRADQRLIRHGHRISVGLLGAEAARGEGLARAARGLALDVALWDQLGCLSPVAVLVADQSGRSASGVAEALAGELERIQEELPRGAIDTATAADVAQERDRAAMRAAAGRAVELHASRGTAWTVVLEDDSAWRLAPLHRFLRVHPVEGVSQLLQALHPLEPHLAGVALAGFGRDSESLSGSLARLGVSRICAPGSLQAPPLGWRRDQRPVLLPMAKIAGDGAP
jgi:hypothetical protein